MHSQCSTVFFSSVSLPSSCAVFGLVFSCRASVGPPAGHITGLIVPANSNLVPSGLDLRPERKLVVILFSFLFLSASVLFPFLVVFFFGCTFIPWYHRYVPGIIWLQVIRDGTPQLVIAPFPCILVLRCTYYFVFFFPIETLFCSLCSDHGVDSREMSIAS